MTLITSLLYYSGLAVAAGTLLLALLMGWWIPALVALGCGGLFAYAGRFVLGRGWRPPPPPIPRPTRRPVYRNRR